MENEELLNDDQPFILSLTDEEGNEVDFELLDSIDYEGKEYLIMLPAQEDATEVFIMEVEPHADGSEDYVTVDDDEILDAVFALFQERFRGFFNFEE